MRTRRTLPSPDRALPAREPFESHALYDLVATLAVHSPGDLLAPHWMVPDRPANEERLARDRFTRRRSRSAARAALALHADGSRLVSRGRHRQERSLVIPDLSWVPTSDAVGASAVPSGAEATPSSLLARARGLLTAAAAWLRRQLARPQR
jgi:hypothetical protein